MIAVALDYATPSVLERVAAPDTPSVDDKVAAPLIVAALDTVTAPLPLGVSVIPILVLEPADPIVTAPAADGVKVK